MDGFHPTLSQMERQPHLKGMTEISRHQVAQSGHGQQNLSTVLATLNLLAFACHTVCELGGRAWRAARRTLVPRTGFFNHLRAITTYLVFPRGTTK